ncbi:MAG: hypothetical protein WC329_07655 [Candidatus Omnitrophota bacterium]|jgi:hypothetical protein
MNVQTEFEDGTIQNKKFVTAAAMMLAAQEMSKLPRVKKITLHFAVPGRKARRSKRGE